MDLEKADYGTIVKFGTLDDFKRKLRMEFQDINNVVNNIDINGISLLQKALISRKFEIAKYLMDNEVKINIISEDGFNELHYLAANINFEGAIEVARLLINNGVDLNHIDKKYGNSAILSVCLELLKKQTEEGVDFIGYMISQSPNIDIVNKSGISTRTLLKERGPDKIKKLIKE